MLSMRSGAGIVKVRAPLPRSKRALNLNLDTPHYGSTVVRMALWID